jgi:hypothetical protein
MDLWVLGAPGPIDAALIGASLDSRPGPGCYGARRVRLGPALGAGRPSAPLRIPGASAGYMAAYAFNYFNFSFSFSFYPIPLYSPTFNTNV